MPTHDSHGNFLHASDRVGTVPAQRKLKSDTTPRPSPRAQATRHIAVLLGVMNFFDYKTVQTRVTRGQITRARRELAQLQKTLIPRL